MEGNNRNIKYNKYVQARIPKTKALPCLLNSFWVGGLICMIGQGISDAIKAIFPALTETAIGGYTSVILIFIASVLTGLGVYDKIGNFAGGGSIVPITGFSNSITSSAMEFKNEGIIFGLCVKMFTIAGPVIVIGIVASIAVGLVYILF